MRNADRGTEGNGLDLDDGDGNPTGDDRQYFDPAAAGAEFRSDPGGGTGTGAGDGAPQRRRRGRTPGSKNSPRSAKANIEGLEKILLSTHAICASFFQVPELAIDEQEAKLVADAAANVAKYYDILPDPKTQAWINLIMVMGAVYGPRAWVIYNKGSASLPSARPSGAEAGPASTPDFGAAPFSVVAGRA